MASRQCPGAPRELLVVGGPSCVPQRAVSRFGSMPFGLSPKDTRNSEQCRASNHTSKFTVTLEDMRKQELMESRSRTSRKSLDFDALQLPSRCRPQKFTPPRMASQLISAAPKECELEADSMT